MSRKQMYWVVDTNGNMSRIFTIGPMGLKQMQNIVGGYIEATRIGVVWNGRPRDLDAYVNERGRLIPLPVNRLYPNIRGPILLGRVSKHSGRFLGVVSFRLSQGELARLN